MKKQCSPKFQAVEPVLASMRPQGYPNFIDSCRKSRYRCPTDDFIHHSVMDKSYDIGTKSVHTLVLLPTDTTVITHGYGTLVMPPTNAAQSQRSQIQQNHDAHGFSAIITLTPSMMMNPSLHHPPLKRKRPRFDSA